MTKRLTYHIADFVITPDLLSIELQGEVTRIEPRLMAVLVFLIENQGSLVSREMLIESVWQGTIVSDNAINRTITQLRKLFGDSATDPQIIETIPKRGYLLKAEVTSEQVNSIQASEIDKKSSETNTNNTFAYFLSAILLVISILLISRAIIIGEPESGQIDLSNLKFETVTSKAGVEAYPSYSSDGTYLAYSFQAPSSESWSIIIRELTSGKEQTVLSSDALNMGSAWSADGEQLAFVRWNNINERKCSVHLVRVKPEIGPERHLFDCGTRSLPHISWLKNENAFVFSDRESISLPYTLFKYHPDTSKRIQLTLPPQSELGHFWSEVSSVNNRLAVLNYIDEKQTELVIFDSIHSEAKKDKSFIIPDRILRVFWLSETELLLYSSSGLKTITLDGQLSNFDNALGSRFTQPVYSPEQRKISAVEIIREQNIWKATLSNTNDLGKVAKQAAMKEIVSSSRIDFSPKYANNSDAIAFLSNRSGMLQIWLKDNSGKETQLTKFPEGLSFSPLRWSHDDSKLLFKKNKSVYQINVVSHQITKLIDEKLGAYNYEFAANNQDIIFTSKKSGDWQLWEASFDNSNKQSTPHEIKITALKQLTSNGGYGPRASKDNEWIYFTKFHQRGLWRIPRNGGTEEKLTPNISKINWLHWQLTSSGAYHIQVDGEKPGIYFFDFAKSHSRLVFEKTLNQSNDFSISQKEDSLIFSQVDSESADIYQSEKINW